MKKILKILLWGLIEVLTLALYILMFTGIVILILVLLTEIGIFM